MTTIREWPISCGGSVATVSLVLNDGADASKQSRECVLSAVSPPLGYHHNADVRALANKRIDTIDTIEVVVMDLAAPLLWREGQSGG